jgi:uncharacterized OB-fold protein
MAFELNKRYIKYFFDPVAESFEEGFWEAVKHRELRFQRCAKCQSWMHPPRPMCHKCKSYDLTWEKSTGKGKVHSWVTFTREVNPLYRVPFDIVLVDMVDEAPVRFIAGIDCPSNEIAFGLPVEIDFMDITDKQMLPIFRKAKG